MTTATTDEDAGLPIQEVARRTGFSESALRYYERIGLIDPVPRDGVTEGRTAASRMVELFAGHAGRLEDELAALRLRHAYARAKVALWQARIDDDQAAEQQAAATVLQVMERLRDHDREARR